MVREVEFNTITPSGIRTITLRYRIVYPSVNPNPGKMLRFLRKSFILVLSGIPGPGYQG
jgi:hypothetical protein